MELTVAALPNETPREHLIRLGEQANQIMSGRAKAMHLGLMPVHDALVQVSKQIDLEQSRLLAIYPELVMVAFEK